MQPGDYDALMVRDKSADYEYADKVAGVLEENGVRVLRNEYEEIMIDGRSVTIVGVDDGWAGMAAPPHVPETDSFTIYLIHEPAYRGNWDADLTLAGHTHGGQIVPAGSERIISGGMVTLSGKIEEGNKITYISRGIGTSNLDITLRASSPEIVVINPSSSIKAVVRKRYSPDGSAEIPFEFFETGVEIARVTPSLPQWGRQHEGASPLDPH